MHDKARSYIRTIVPVVLGHAAAWLVAWMATNAGVSIDTGLAYEVFAVACSAAVYVAGRRLETSRATVLRGIGRFLLSLGADLGQPVYVQKGAAAPRSAAALRSASAAATLGETAYNAYGNAVGWRTYAGGPMHPWGDLSAKVRTGWVEAAAAARSAAGD